MMRPQPRSTLFPYTTLFRSAGNRQPGKQAATKAAKKAAKKQGGRQNAPAAETDNAEAADDADAQADDLDSADGDAGDRKSTRLNSSHPSISYAVFCLKKKNK